MLTPLAAANAVAVLPLADAKAHLRVLDTSEDVAIASMTAEAVDFVERYASVALTVRNFLWEQDHFTSVIRLPIRPINTVSAISYYDGSGVDTAMDSSGWFYGRGSVAAAIGSTWPVANGQPGGVRITFSAGYTMPEDIPPMLLSGVKLALAALFDDRESPNFDGAMRCCDRHRPVL